MSCNPSTGATDRDGTILDGQGTTRILMSHCGEFSNTLDADYHDIPIAYRPVRIEGFTFTNGVTTTSDGLPFAGNGGGLLMYGRAQKSGQEPSKVVDCLFADCSAVNGGGAALVGGILERCVFTGNQASSKGGGAAFVQPTTAQGRRANYDFSCTWYSPAAVGCSFTNNTAAAEGGGLALNTNGIDQNVWVSGCGFFCNTAVTGSSACNIAHGSTISNCVFRGNSGANYGVVNCGSHEWFTDCTFENNSARYGTAFVGNSGVRFTRCKFIGNTGAGVWGYATLVNCLIADSSGGACLQAFYDDKEIVCEGCTLVSKNTYAPVNLNRISFRVSLTDCIVWQRGSSFPFDSVAAASSITATNCCFSASPGASVADSFTLVDTFARDPRFKDADGGDYSIRHSSPCRDKAVFLPWMNAVACDLAGNPRVVTDGKPLAELPSARPDIGCYENQDTIKGTMLTFR